MLEPYSKLTIYLLLLGICACGGTNRSDLPYHHSGLLRTQWTSSHSVNTPPRKTESDAATKNSSIPPDALPHSNSLVEAAMQLLKTGKAAAHYGATDVYTIYKNAGYPDCWSVDDDVPDLLKKANAKKAYMTRNQPSEGDIILFHNQFDRNRNGQFDDWFTGAGIVVSSKRGTHVVVTRTNDAPRQIYITPEGPMVHDENGTPLNSFVKIPKPYDPPNAEYLSGQLYAGFIRSEMILSTCRKKNK